MARMGHMRGWPAARLATRAKTHFYAELADVIEKWQREGFSVVVGGDLNDDWDGDAGVSLRDWAQRLGLVNAHEFLHDRGRVRGETATFVGSDGRAGRRIDHLLVSEGAITTLAGHQGTLATRRPRGQWGHRALILANTTLGNTTGV